MIQFKENVHTDNKWTSRTYFIWLFWLLLTRIKKKLNCFACFSRWINLTLLLTLSILESFTMLLVLHQKNLKDSRSTILKGALWLYRETVAYRNKKIKRVEIRMPSYLIAGKWNYDTNLLVCLMKKLRWDLKYYIFLLKICQCMSLFFQLALKFSFCNQGT